MGNISLFKKKIIKEKGKNIVNIAKNDNNIAKKIKLNARHMLQDCKYEFKNNYICENKNNIAFELNIIFEKKLFEKITSNSYYLSSTKYCQYIFKLKI